MSMMKQVRDDLANQIDTQAILDAIIDSLDDDDLKVTPDNIKSLWSNFLVTELGRGLTNCIRYGNIDWE